jgi:hypothetical protein
MNLAHANIHYVCLAHQGTPTLLSSSQIAYLCKKKATSSKVGKANGIVTRETDDIYKFLEELGNYYVSLLTCGPTEDTTIASKDMDGSSTLFNEICIGNFTGHKDVEGRRNVDQELLQVVLDDHCRELNTADSNR